MGNKEIFSANLRKYIEMSGKTRTQLCDEWNVPRSTLGDWINGTKYPRIDKIELMADYFGISMSELIDDQKETHEKNDTIADIIIRLRTDSRFLRAVEKLNQIEAKQLIVVAKLLDALID